MNAILIPAMGILNRASGMEEWFPGRNIYATSVITGVLAGLISGPVFGLLCFMAMLCYRIPGWGGLIGLTNLRDAALLALRSMTVGIPFIIHDFGPATILATVGTGLACSGSYCAGWWLYRRGAIGKDPILVAELLAGFCIGFFFWRMA